jgi:hypothetical protein
VVKNQRDGTRGSDVVDGGAFNLVPCMAVVAPISRRGVGRRASRGRHEQPCHRSRGSSGIDQGFEGVRPWERQVAAEARTRDDLRHPTLGLGQGKDDSLDVVAVGLEDRIRFTRENGGEVLEGMMHGTDDSLAEQNDENLSVGDRYQSLF